MDTISGAGLQVDPSAGVTHKGAVGGPFSGSPRDYTMANNGGLDVDYEVRLDPVGTAPLLLDGGTSAIVGTLPSGGGSAMVSVSVDASAAAALGMGTYATDVIFEDVTNGREEVRTHTLEVGLTEIEVTPAADLQGGGPVGGPLGPSRTYTVTSTQPNPVSVSVVASNSWISLDGAAAPVAFQLSGLGDSRTITVGFSASATTLGAGLYTGSVSFTNTTSGMGDTTRGVHLDIGRVAVSATDTPVAIIDNSPFQSEIEVMQDVEIGDVNIKLDITHTFIGDLIVDVVSPAGTTVRLHNRTGGSDDDILTTYNDDGDAPDGPGVLADFNGESALGTWTLLGSDNAGIDQGSLNSWTLLIGAAPATAPPDCPGDLNGDGLTDIYDFGLFASTFGQSVAPNTGGDMNGDGFVDVHDFAIFGPDFGCAY